MDLDLRVECQVGLWVRSSVMYCESFMQNFHFRGLRIAVSVCQGHQSKGSRIMNEFNFDDKSFIMIVFRIDSTCERHQDKSGLYY